MRAIQIQEFGGPEVLKLVDLPIPKPNDNELLIRVEKAGINFADTHRRTNSYLAKATLPYVPGSEVIGECCRTGKKVLAFCEVGGYAEYVVAKSDLVFPVLEGLDNRAALACFVQGVTAFHLVHTVAKLTNGERVLIHSAAGGTGSMILQLAKIAGAGLIVATASTTEKRDQALEQGADYVVDSSSEGMLERLKLISQEESVDIVFETEGGKVFEQSYHFLAPFGRLVVYGISSRVKNTLSSSSLLRTSRSVAGFWFQHCLEQPSLIKEGLHYLFKLLDTKKIKPAIGGEYSLDRVQTAHQDLQSRKTSGKLLLSLDS